MTAAALRASRRSVRLRALDHRNFRNRKTREPEEILRRYILPAVR